MTTTLTAIGGYGLVIDRKILQQLRISPDTELDVSVVRGCIVIAPSNGGSSATTKLTAIDDGYGVLIDGKIIQQLGISSDTKLDISADDRRIVVKPIKPIKPIAEPSDSWPRKRPWRPIVPTPEPEPPEEMVHLPTKQPW